MKRQNMLLVLNIVLVASMFLGPFAVIARAGTVQPRVSEAVLSPTDAGLSVPTVAQPNLDVVLPYDAQSAAINEVLSEVGFPDGVMLLEPFGEQTAVQAAQVALPETAVSLPAVPDPFANVQVDQSQPTGLATLSASEAEDDSLDVGDESIGHATRSVLKAKKWVDGERPLWNSINSNDFMSILPASQPWIAQPQSVDSYVDWTPPHPNAVVTVPVRPNSEQVFLPVIKTPGIAPSNEITVYPDRSAVFNSTDDLIRVEVPAGAYDEPFILRYIPAQELTGGYWSLDAVTLNGKLVELNRSAQLFMRLPETRSGKPLIFRYRDISGKAVSLGAYTADTSMQLLANGTENSAEYLTSYIQNFGQFTYASLDDDDNPDEGDDGLIVSGYCWEPGTQADYLLSFAN
ncbi:MAG: hypothetical protein KC443_13435, partial [Anaerolineales bacterium]|nr:hypothetical protein [Anaerolineales bacterium]